MDDVVIEDPSSTKVKKKSYLRAILTAVAVIIPIIILVTLIIIYKPSETTSTPTARPSLSPQRITVDPCDDFYQHICKQEIENYNDELPWSFNTRQSDALTLQFQYLHHLLNSSVQTKDKNSVSKAKLFYQSCTNQMPKSILDSIEQLISKMGGWPLRNQKFEKKPLAEVLGFFKGKFDSPSIFEIFIEDIAQQYSFTISRTFVDDFYPDLEMIVSRLKNITSYFIEDIQLQKINEFANEVVQFYGELQQFASIDYLNDDANVTLLTIKEFTDRCQFDWKTFWKIFFKVQNLDEVDENLKISVHDISFFENFHDTLQKYEPEFYQNLLVFTSLYRITSLYAEVNESEVFNILRITPESSYLNRKCFLITYDVFSQTLINWYTQNHFEKLIKKLVDEVVPFIKSGFKEIIKSSSWLGSDKRSYDSLLQAVDTLRVVVGYKTNQKVNNEIETNYKDVPLTNQSFIINSWLLHMQKNKILLKKLGREYIEDLYEDQTNPFTVITSFDTYKMKINIAFPILQLFSRSIQSSYPALFGSIGFAISHEIIHRFDLENLISPSVKISKNSLQTFHNKSICMISQYDDIFWKIAEKKLDGNKTRNEDLCDNGAIKVAFKALHSWRKINPSKHLTPRLLSSRRSNQIFFTEMAKIFCEKYDTESALKKLSSLDVHSPGEFRVNQVLKNFPEFGKTFQCKKGVSNMYPKEDKICSVW